LANTLFEDPFDVRKVISNPILSPMDDGVEADGDPAGMAHEADKRGQLLHRLLPRGNPGFQGRPPQPGDGEMAEDMVVDRQRLPEASPVGQKPREIFRPKDKGMHILRPQRDDFFLVAPGRLNPHPTLMDGPSQPTRVPQGEICPPGGGDDRFHLLFLYHRRGVEASEG